MYVLWTERIYFGVVVCVYTTLKACAALHMHVLWCLYIYMYT